ncbi:MAG TPA: DsrE family protein [Puia sp.]|nr:DsrE family protein [Puia sp.]
MKKQLVFTLTAMFAVMGLCAQSRNYKVVFDLSSKDTVNQQSITREIGLITDANPDAKIEVVIYGQGLDLAVKGRSRQEAAVQQLITGNKASFKVCAMTLKRNNIDKSELVPGVEVVPDGIYEIISRQQEGWGYIKVGH